MSYSGCPLQSARGFQFDRGKHYVTKNYEIWFGISQTRKSEGQMTILRKYRLKDFEKLIDRQMKNSQTYVYYNRPPDVLWLIDLNENLAGIFLLRLPLVTAIYFEITLENISTHVLDKKQQNLIRTSPEINGNSDPGWFQCPPLAALIHFGAEPEYATEQLTTTEII